MHSENQNSGWGTQDIELHLLFSIQRIHVGCVSFASKNMAPSQFLGFFAILCRKWWHRPQSLISCPLRAVCLFSSKVVRRRSRVWIQWCIHEMESFTVGLGLLYPLFTVQPLVLRIKLQERNDGGWLIGEASCNIAVGHQLINLMSPCRL